MTIQILGRGCTRCRKLTEIVKAAADQLGLNCTVELVQDLRRIVAAGTMLTPALVIDGQIKSAGRMLSVEEVAGLLRDS